MKDFRKHCIWSLHRDDAWQQDAQRQSAIRADEVRGSLTLTQYCTRCWSPGLRNIGSVISSITTYQVQRDQASLDRERRYIQYCLASPSNNQLFLVCTGQSSTWLAKGRSRPAGKTSSSHLSSLEHVQTALATTSSDVAPGWIANLKRFVRSGAGTTSIIVISSKPRPQGS